MDIPATPSTPVLRCEKVSKSFGGLRALHNVDLSISPGERRSIIGPNGAGKTTLFNIICGEMKATSGSVYISGEDVTRLPSYARLKRGLARTFQVTNLFREMTVLENVLLAILGCNSDKGVFWRSLNSYTHHREQANELLERFGLSNLRNECPMNLSYGDQRLLEVILGLGSRPRILALDEPSSGLSAGEASRLVGILNSLDPQLTLVVIEHDMRVAFDVTRTMTVLCEGQVLADGTVESVRNDSRVQEVYFGGGVER